MAAHSVLPIILFVVIGLALVSGDYNQNDKIRLEKKWNLLKSQDNEIDHGPIYKTNPALENANMSNKKKQILLGHMGEHWSNIKKGKSNYISSNYKNVQEHLKSAHNDDARLQDLEYQPKFEQKKKFEKRTHKKVWKKNHQKDPTRQFSKEKNQKKIFLKKSMKKEIKKALKKGMSFKQIHEKFAKEKKFPKKLYKKYLVKKFRQQKKNEKKKISQP